MIESLRARGALPASEAARWTQADHVGDVAWRTFSALDRAYPEGTLGVTWEVGRRSRRGEALLVPAAVLAALGAVVLTVLDLTNPTVERWLAEHNWTNQMVGSLVVVLATYVIVDRVVDRRRAERWLAVAEHPILDYVRELAEFKTDTFELGRLTIAAADLEDGGEAVPPELEEDLAECRSQLLRTVGVLDDLRTALAVFFGVVPELTDLLPTQLRIDRYVELVDRTLSGQGSAATGQDGGEFLERWPAFRDAFNLHILAVHDVLGPSEIDALFEKPQEREEKIPGLDAPGTGEGAGSSEQPLW